MKFYRGAYTFRSFFCDFDAAVNPRKLSAICGKRAFDQNIAPVRPFYDTNHTSASWYFRLTIQNTANRHVSSAFDFLAIFICFTRCALLLLLLLLLRQLRIFAAAAARPTPSRPHLWGGKVRKRRWRGRCHCGFLFCWRCVNGVIELRETSFPRSSTPPYGLALRPSFSSRVI